MMEHRLVITQGEHTASNRPEVVISTLLGSCVACCLWDAEARAGGMNHILLANNVASDTRSNLAGVNEMELLINDVLKLGGRRDRLRAKVFGGARMISNLSGIGQANADFVLRFLVAENIEVVSKSVGGAGARHVLFWPSTGAARQKIQPNTDLREAPPPPAVMASGNELELF